MSETKITVIYDNPTDADAFEAGYPDQVVLAKALPGVTRRRMPGTVDGDRSLSVPRPGGSSTPSSQP